MWKSQRPYKRIIVSPFAFLLYLYNGQVMPYYGSFNLFNDCIIHIGSSKCGGTTINNEICKHKHLILNKRQWEYYKDKCFKFVFVRSPYSYVLSTYMAFIKGKNTKKYYINGTDSLNYEWGGILNNYKSLKSLSFEAFVKLICKVPDHATDAHLQNKTYVWDKMGIKPDFIGKIESFSKDWNKIHKIIGISSSNNLKIQNKGNYNKQLSKYYTKELIFLIEERYKKDIKGLGYSNHGNKIIEEINKK